MSAKHYRLAAFLTVTTASLASAEQKAEKIAITPGAIPASQHPPPISSDELGATLPAGWNRRKAWEVRDGAHRSYPPIAPLI